MSNSRDNIFHQFFFKKEKFIEGAKIGKLRFIFKD